MSELWDLYTMYREKTGLDMVRGNPIPDGYLHLSVHVWMRNGEGKYLIFQRSATRPNFPLKWESVAGAVLKGETSFEAALREVKEEIGIDLCPEDGKKCFTNIRLKVDGRVFNRAADVYLFRYDGEANLENAPTDEVAQCRWMSREEILALIDAGEFVETQRYFRGAFESPEPDYRDIIGTKVRCVIDRPLGSRHPRKPAIVYRVNYGYVPGVTGGDGAEQDVYVIGVNEPLDEFEGTVIGVYHRYDDVENKWIVAPDGMNFTDDRILGDIAFVEQFFFGKLYR